MSLVHRIHPPRLPSERPPLLVLLHGIGSDEDDLFPLAMALPPRFLVASVRAPYPEQVGHRWYAIDWTAAPPRGDAEEMLASRDLLGRFVEEAVAANGTDPTRTFLLGFSQGAVMALALLLARPDLVRGVVAHSGRLARLPGQEPTPEAFARAEVLLLHGREDQVAPVAGAERAQEILRPLLGERVTLDVFDELGHGLSSESLSAAARWLAARAA